MPSVLQPVDPNERSRIRRLERRRELRRRRLRAAAILLGLIAAGIVGALIAAHIRRQKTALPAAAVTHSRMVTPRPYPQEVRGLHVSMALAGIPGKLEQYVALKRDGLNTIELDVKDETGVIAFAPAGDPLARRVHAFRQYYDPALVAARVHAAGLYLIGRVVVFEDPILSAAMPQLAVRRADGSRWLNNAGLGWTNPYDTRVWRYNIAVATAAARAGFDEIQFDYVRFPSDGDISQIRYPGMHVQPMGWTVPMFVKEAASGLHRLGVRVSVDVFGLSATRDLGIGQFPARLAHFADTIYPMVYPSHYGPGEYGIVSPDARPGVTVAYSLRDFRTQLQHTPAQLIPWLQDFSLGRHYSLADVQDEIQSARLEHVKGFMLWNADGAYTKGALSTPPFR